MNGVRVSIIVAADEQDGIGNKKEPRGLPWPRHREDMLRFIRTRRGKPVILGRVTYETIPRKFRPLKGSPTIVVSRDKDFSAEGARMAKSLQEALGIAIEAAKNLGIDEIIIAGGEQVYREALGFGYVDRIYLTRIMGSYRADAYFPTHWESSWVESENSFHPADSENPKDMIFLTYDKKPR